MAKKDTRPTQTKKKSEGKRREEHEIVLICNPQAGGRWKELAAILEQG